MRKPLQQNNRPFCLLFNISGLTEVNIYFKCLTLSLYLRWWQTLCVYPPPSQWIYHDAGYESTALLWHFLASFTIPLCVCCFFPALPNSSCVGCRWWALGQQSTRGSHRRLDWAEMRRPALQRHLLTSEDAPPAAETLWLHPESLSSDTCDCVGAVSLWILWMYTHSSRVKLNRSLCW